MVFDRRIDRVRVRVRRHDAADVSEIGNVGELFDPAPALAAVFGHLNQSVISADIDQSFFLWRLSQRRGITKEGRGLILGDCIDAPDPAHHRQLVAIQAARKLAADNLPAIAAIVAAKKFVGSEIDARDDDWRIPIPSQWIFVATNLGLNVHALAGALVKARKRSVLEFSVDGIWIFGIDLGAKSIPAQGDKPVGIGYARHIPSSRRPAHVKVVLRSAVNIVEGRGIVGGDIIDLHNWEIPFEVPIRAAIVAFVHSAVTADQVMFVVVWIDPDFVIVDMLGFLAQTAQGPATIVRDHQKYIHYVNAIYKLWIGDDPRVIHRAGIEFVPSFPTAPTITRTEDSAFPVRGFDSCVDDIGINRRNRQADAAHLSRRQPGP